MDTEGAPGVWAGLIYTPCADRGLCRTILYCAYTKTDTLRAEPCFSVSSSVKTKGEKALEGCRGVSYSGDHYQQLLYIHVVAASSKGPCELLFFKNHYYFVLGFFVLLICICREFLEKTAGPPWPGGQLNPRSCPLMSYI